MLDSSNLHAGRIYRCSDASGAVSYKDHKDDSSCEPFIDSPAEPRATEILEGLVSGPPTFHSGNLTGTGMARFYEKLLKLDKGTASRITVFHIGDSHVRSAAFPRRTAMLLQERFGSGGGEFCYPTPPPKPRRGTKKSKKRVTDNPVLLPDTCRPATTLPSSSEKGLSYNVYGNSGKTFAWFASYPDVARQIKQYQPDLIIVTLGTNDAFARLDYQAAWKSLDGFMATIRSASPDSSVLFTTPPDCFFHNGQHNSHIEIIRKATIAFASLHDSSVWDFTTAMGGAGSMNRWLESGYAFTDRIHLNAKGYTEKGEMLYREIIAGFEGYVKK